MRSAVGIYKLKLEFICACRTGITYNKQWLLRNGYKDDDCHRVLTAARWFLWSSAWTVRTKNKRAFPTTLILFLSRLENIWAQDNEKATKLGTTPNLALASKVSLCKLNSRSTTSFSTRWETINSVFEFWIAPRYVSFVPIIKFVCWKCKHPLGNGRRQWQRPIYLPLRSGIKFIGGSIWDILNNQLTRTTNSITDLHASPPLLWQSNHVRTDENDWVGRGN